MRNILRIPIVIENIDWKLFITDVLEYGDDWEVNRLYNLIQATIEEIEDYWLENPDERLTQVLVNTGLIPNKPGFWYYTEEVQWMIEKKLVEPRDILFWGSIFDENGNRRPKTVWTPIKTITDDHLKAIVAYFTYNLTPKVIKEEIKLRNLEL